MSGRLREFWLSFWYGPVCARCKRRHPEQLVDIAICIAQCALDREMAYINAHAALADRQRRDT